jgi:Ca2+:H+ antiporter
MPASRHPTAFITPVIALGVAIAATTFPDLIKAIPGSGAVWPIVEFAVLGAAVFAAVHHADVVAHRTGEPYGTLVLTIAVMVIEVSLIISIMLAGDGSPTLARDTILGVIMVVCNGLVGLCIIMGGLKYGEQGFHISGARAYLVVLMPLATMTLILPNYTISAPGAAFNASQLVFVAVATIVLYGIFLYVQTVRHRDYFLSDDGMSTADEHAHVPSDREVAISVVMLVAALVAVVLLAKHFAETVKLGVAVIGAPITIIGLLVAMMVLLPESLAALRAAKRNELQKSINLALGSSLATIGLTIPAVCAVSIVLNQPLNLGLETRDIVLLVLTFGVSLVTFGGGRTNILPGVVHLVLFATYVFLIFAP